MEESRSGSIRRVAVIGAGTMGRGIAQIAAAAGFEVSLYDVTAELAAAALARIRETLDAGVSKGKVTAEARERTLAGIRTTPDLQDAARGADLVVEAAPENLELKQDIFRKLSAACAPAALLASNTSSLPIGRIAQAATGPERVVGMHFFNPPHIMKLVEIVRAGKTSGETVEAAAGAAARMGKETIVVNDVAGFATSRLGLALGLEAMRMVEQGVASAADIDKAMELGYGHPMGPLRVSDLVGLDVRLSIADTLKRELGVDRFEAPGILREKVRAGKLGKKSGEGFYVWKAKS